jgi:hypothetical protein
MLANGIAPDNRPANLGPLSRAEKQTSGQIETLAHVLRLTRLTVSVEFQGPPKNGRIEAEDDVD